MLVPTPPIDGDFLNSDHYPVLEMGEIAPGSVMRFVNRELSWLAFNWQNASRYRA